MCSCPAPLNTALGIMNRRRPNTMHSARLRRSRLLSCLLAATTFAGNAATSVFVPPGEYDLTTQTVLPHLEEALRYATTRTRQCLSEPDVTSFFPILQHPAFSGCSLVPSTKANDGLRFTLQCTNPEAASGSAVFEFGASYLSAVLEFKMGGKNMTLSQRLYGPRVGPCSESNKK